MRGGLELAYKCEIVVRSLSLRSLSYEERFIEVDLAAGFIIILIWLIGTSDLDVSF